VDKQYEQFCIADPVFYDHPRNRSRQDGFPITSRPLPSDWRREHLGDWVVALPPDNSIPKQGWKIHVSATLENANDTITRSWEYCTSRAICFKFLPSKISVLMHNAKYAPRGSSGKVVTIYPVDEAALERTLAELDQLLDGAAGPYILSDLRYGTGPLYVRYGGFVERRCLDDSGSLVLAIEDADGNLVPDIRQPVFKVPSWVRLPDFLEPHLAARNAIRLEDHWLVEHALHFSNGGGVYLATDTRTGEQVILKEARPHAGLGADGSDAVARLRREYEFLKRLEGLGVAPEARDYFEVGEHHFLAEELIEGTTLNSFYARRHPLLLPDPDPAEVAEYTSWALRVCASIERSTRAMHERGVIFNDLHMFNIMVRPDDTVAFIDFEAASELGEGRRMTVGNPGFMAPRDREGFAVDAYSTACIRLAMFAPLTSLFVLDREKPAHIAEVIAEHFPAPRDFLDEAVREIAGPEAQRRPEYPDFAGQTWDSLIQPFIRAIRASATPERDDRLFPGDIEQFAAPACGLGIAHGAAGVLYALSEAAGVRIPEYEEWLVTRSASPPKSCRLGLYDGLAGVAYTLARLGHAEAARKTTDLCLGSPWEQLGTDLFGGLAGFSLAMLDLSDLLGEPGARDAGLRAAEIVADRARDAEEGAAGLVRGTSGHALLFLRLYERTGDPAYLDSAEAAIRTDLARCVTDTKGALQVDEGWRIMPYLNAGSAGIGMVIDRFLAHRRIDDFARAAEAIRIAARSVYYAQSGLFNGRAGMILYLASHNRDDRYVAAHIRRLAWHAIRYRDGLAFSGDMLLRLSMDLATGTAGVLLALAAALAPHEAALPFLGPPKDHPAQGMEKETLNTWR
jgi:predicted Ser/Thr protein kinase